MRRTAVAGIALLMVVLAGAGCSQAVVSPAAGSPTAPGRIGGRPLGRRVVRRRRIAGVAGRLRGAVGRGVGTPVR